MEKKWDRLLQDAEVSTDLTGWPYGCIGTGPGTGGNIASTLSGLTHTPDFVIIDGEATHPSTITMLGARNLRLWGSHRATTVWALRDDRRHPDGKYHTLPELATALNKYMQCRMSQAHMAVGRKRFKGATQDTDFARDRIADSLMDDEEWGTDLSPAELREARFWEWLEEPTTKPAAWDSPDITGIEIPETLTTAEAQARADDLIQWKAEGQTWWGAMLPAAQARMRLFLAGNEAANDTVARAMSALPPGAEGPNYPDAMADRVNEMRVPQGD
jgi:hypothetical protein